MSFFKNLFLNTTPTNRLSTSTHWQNHYCRNLQRKFLIFKSILFIRSLKTTNQHFVAKSKKISTINASLNHIIIKQLTFKYLFILDVQRYDRLSIKHKAYSLFNINWIKKEQLYTKLKYSRSPQYDIVSGGFAALLAGFIGFLISEKFGLELMDSGDFYIFFMYMVLCIFSLRPFFKIYSLKITSFNILSLKYGFEFYLILLKLTLNVLMQIQCYLITHLFTLLKFIKKQINRTTTFFKKLVRRALNLIKKWFF